MDIVSSLVSPYISSLLKTLLLAIQAPIRKLKLSETDAKNVAPERLDPRTVRAVTMLFLSSCKNSNTRLNQM